MKKLVIMVMLLLNIFVFGEKFHSDGNTNLEKLKGTWDSRFWEIVKKKNEWYRRSRSSDGYRCSIITN